MRLVAAGERLDSVFNLETNPDNWEREATPLMVAAGSKDGATVETIKLLIGLGADPKAQIKGRSALTFACTGLSSEYDGGGDVHRLRAVLAAGCVLPRDPRFASELLCSASAAGDPERLAILLDLGLSTVMNGDPTRGDSAPWRWGIPLFRAAESGSAECVRLLLAAGADPLVRDRSQHTAMFSAMSVEVIRVLQEVGASLEETVNGYRPLTAALYEPHPDQSVVLRQVRVLVDAGAEVKTPDPDDSIFLMAVRSRNCRAVLETLVSAGADPRAVSKSGCNAFHEALFWDWGGEDVTREVLQYLKELGLDVDHRNSVSATPLADAILEGSGYETALLCEQGADPNAVCPLMRFDTEPHTFIDVPLLFHSVDGTGVRRDVKTEALLKAGADPRVRCPQGRTPLMYAIALACADAGDPDMVAGAFLSGLSGLRLERETMPQSRDAFIARSVPVFRAFVDRFASDIPLIITCQFSEEWRTEHLNCIVLLSAYERWWNHQALGHA